MMQRVTNMEMLKLSYWNPAKDMKSILIDIKQFLQQWHASRSITNGMIRNATLTGRTSILNTIC